MNKKVIKWLDKRFKDDLSGKTILITGANSGLGFEVSKDVVYLNGHLIMAVRNLEKGKAAKEEILKEFKDAKIDIVKLDVSSIESIKEFNEYIITNKIDIDYFFSNAGIFRAPKEIIEGEFEKTFFVNYLSNIFILKDLIPYLKTLNHPVNFIFNTSISALLTKVDLNDLQSINKYKPTKAYERSKFYVLCALKYLSNKYSDTNIIFTACHPGATYTPLIIKGFKNKFMYYAAKIAMPILFHSPSKASLCTMRLLLDTAKNGDIVGPRGIFHLSGYPTKHKIRRRKVNKTYIRIIQESRALVDNH